MEISEEATSKGMPLGNLLVIVASGILFGLGLSVSEMVILPGYLVS